MTRRAVERLGPDTRAAFRDLLEAPPEGWCFCVAWEVPTWDGWGRRSADDNRRLRESLWRAGEYHGYVCRLDDAPVGWMRVGPTGAWPKLCRERGLAPSDTEHVFTCFGLRPELRRRGHMREFLALALDDLARRGVRRVHAVPKHPVAGSEDGHVWNGPAALFAKAGFVITGSTDSALIMSRDLAPPAR